MTYCFSIEPRFQYHSILLTILLLSVGLEYFFFSNAFSFIFFKSVTSLVSCIPFFSNLYTLFNDLPERHNLVCSSLVWKVSIILICADSTIWTLKIFTWFFLIYLLSLLYTLFLYYFLKYFISTSVSHFSLVLVCIAPYMELCPPGSLPTFCLTQSVLFSKEHSVFSKLHWFLNV